MASIRMPKLKRIARGDTEAQAGRWRPLGKKAMLSCPSCGKELTLTPYTIGDGGIVSPSVVCPHGCGFHEYVMLEAWR